MQLIITVLCAAAAAFAQTAESGMPVTDAEKIADALRAGPVFVTKDAPMLDWPRRPEANIAFFVRVRINGPVSWAILDFHTMSRRASTRPPPLDSRQPRRAYAAHRSHRHRVYVCRRLGERRFR